MAQVYDLLNLKGYQNCIFGSKVLAILLNGLILPYPGFWKGQNRDLLSDDDNDDDDENHSDHNLDNHNKDNHDKDNHNKDNHNEDNHFKRLGGHQYVKCPLYNMYCQLSTISYQQSTISRPTSIAYFLM